MYQTNHDKHKQQVKKKKEKKKKRKKTVSSRFPNTMVSVPDRVHKTQQ